MSKGSNQHMSFPFRIGTNGRIAQVVSLKDHIRDEIVQLLLTNTGERYFLPELGGGVRQLIFNNTDELAMAKAKSLITQALSKWLKDRIELINLTLSVSNEEIQIIIKYKIIGFEDTETIELHNLEI